MTLCWLPFVPLLAAALLREQRLCWVGNMCLLLGILLMILIVAGQDYGNDQNNYQLYYESVDWSNAFTFGLERGYVLSMVFFKEVLRLDFYDYLFFINTCLIGVFLYVSWRYSRNVALSLLLFYGMYFFLYETTALRQGVAFCFTLYSLRYIVERKVLPFCICIAFGFLFHSSALLFLPAYWVASWLKVSTRQAYWLIVLFFPFVFVDMVPLLGQFTQYFADAEKYNDLYISASGEHKERVGLGIGVVVKIIFFVMYASTYSRESVVQTVLFRIGLFYLLLYFPCSSISILSSRGLDYYKVFDCIYLTYALYNQKERLLRFSFSVIVLMYITYSLWDTALGVKNFSSVLQDIVDLI